MTDISRRKLFGAAGAASLGLAGMVPVWPPLPNAASPSSGMKPRNS